MAPRLGRLVGLAAAALVVLRLGRVLDVAADAADWRLVGLAAAVLGGLVSWIGAAYRLGAVRMSLLHLLGIAVLIERVVAGGTLRFGVVPGPETGALLSSELGNALDVLQFGAPPVIAVPGLTALVAAGLWLLGAAWAWGATTGHTWLGIAPALGFYLYLAVVDRAPAGPWWMVSFAVVAVLGLLATNLPSGSEAGRARDRSNRPVPRRRAGAPAVVGLVVVTLALAGVGAAGAIVDGNGAIAWRNPGGAGSGLGDSGVSYNLFVGLRQQVVSQSDVPVFVASVDANAPANRQMYWRLITLDEYDGVNWSASAIGFDEDPGEGVWGDESMQYRGPTEQVRQAIQIESLRQDYLPALSSPVSVAADDPLITSGLRIRNDGSLNVAGLTSRGLTYTVTSEVPRLDVARLASADGQLSPIFAEAAAEGVFEAAPVSDEPAPTPDAVEAYLQLPDVPDGVAELAADITADASTSFEQALLLEQYFRSGDRFDYDTSVSTGQGSLELEAWLTDPDSTNYRTGYCEQFATAMAVMGRTIGLPTRVAIGFTPGEARRLPNGNTGIEVLQRNAHAWVEVWLDEAGWVRFDPTPRSDGINRPTTESVGFDPSTITPPDTGDESLAPLRERPDVLDAAPNLPTEDVTDVVPVDARERGSVWWWVAAAVAVAAAALPAAKWWRRRRRLQRISDGDVTAAWEEIVDRLSDLGAGPRPSQTPLEFADATDRSLVPLANAYSAAVYGGRTTNTVDLQFASAEAWLRSTYGGRRRAAAAFSPRSMSRT